ncbi:hypothetical protein P171DRAFT_509896 [Karstenula rhodostoma CBS 690.94]|uniref:Uncharacterized protein n=1 Tax=Karstenula rhodostoma CBS 690.94 TaxID=1392251 RepID=A0A9P4UFS8_9PLEO|nr:hypothetical protein P171DRAFT_509896 [Karstenula rhodostoma CBS 690.94]
MREPINEIQYPFRETNRSPYYLSCPGPYLGDPRIGETSSSTGSPTDEYAAKPISEHQHQTGRSIEAGDPPHPHPDDVDQVPRSNTMAAATNRQREMLAQLDGTPMPNGEHSSVSAYTASLLQGDPPVGRAVLEQQIERWSEDVPRDAPPGYAGTTPDTRVSRRFKMSKMISRLRSPCPELRKRVCSFGEDNQPTSTLPPNEVPLPPKPPRTAPPPKTLRRRTDTHPTSQRPNSPTYRLPSSPRGDSPIPPGPVRRSTVIPQIRTAQLPSTPRVFAPRPRRTIIADWFRNSALAPDDTRFDSPFDHLRTEPRVAHQSTSLEHLGSLLRLPDAATKLKPSLRGGARKSSPTSEHRANEDQSPLDQGRLDQGPRRLPINAVLTAAASSLDGAFPPGHPRRTTNPSNSHPPTHQSSRLPLSADPSQYSQLQMIPHTSQPPLPPPLNPRSQPFIPYRQQFQQQPVDLAQVASMQQPQHTDSVRNDWLRWLQNTDPAQYELLQQLESASREEQYMERYLQQPHFSPGERATLQDVLERYQTRRRALVRQYQHRFPQANNMNNPYQQTSNAYVSPYPPVQPPHQQQPPNYGTIHPRISAITTSNSDVPQHVAPEPLTGPRQSQPHYPQTLSIGYPGSGSHMQLPWQPVPVQSLSVQPPGSQPNHVPNSNNVYYTPYSASQTTRYPGPYTAPQNGPHARTVTSEQRPEAPTEDDVFEIPLLVGRELDPADPVDRSLMDTFGMDYSFDASFEVVSRHLYEYYFGPQDSSVRVSREWRAHRADIRGFVEEVISRESEPPREAASSSRNPRPVSGGSAGGVTLPSLREVLGDYFPERPRDGPGPGASRPGVLRINSGESTATASLSPGSDSAEADRRERERQQVRLDSEMPITIRGERPPGMRGRRRAGAVSEGTGNGSGEGSVLLRDAYEPVEDVARSSGIRDGEVGGNEGGRAP